jgi:alkanesulfonate monooxygenase SsuD/methylene tetrahydromethanopterin reductase-like flavin-dependent oxidoreductase (luciferase family)
VRFAINTPNFGPYGNVHLLADLAHEAEESGWDGFFIWDHIGSGPDWAVQFVDPWIALSAMAMRTRTIKIGPMVTPMPRRRPWKLARETVSLDHLASGRLIFGVGLGSDIGREFSCFGEASSDKLHGEMLDEGLEVLTGLWSGEAFSYDGDHYQLSNALFLPQPRQHPRIPIWVAGTWPHKKPFQRAAQWDGVFPIGSGYNHILTSEDFRKISEYMKSQRRGRKGTFDVVASGHTSGFDKGKDIEMMDQFADAGVTWWQEALDWNYSLAQVRERIHQGPPRE